MSGDRIVGAIWLVVLATIAFSCAHSTAQHGLEAIQSSAAPDTAKGNLLLQVRDGNSPMAFCNVYVDLDHNQCLTDENGQLALRLRPGRYYVVVKAVGFKPQNPDTVTVLGGETAKLTHHLVGKDPVMY